MDFYEDENKDDRVKVQEALALIREMLVEERVWLFLGEQVSSLPRRCNTWWEYLSERLDDSQMCVDEVRECEKVALEDPTCVYLFNTLRMVATWPGVMTVNPDHLVEKLLWKDEGGVEKIRLDQLSALENAANQLKGDSKYLIKIYGDGGLVTRFTVSSRSLLTSPDEATATTLHSLIDANSFLFLGLNVGMYDSFFKRFVVNSKRRHFMLSRDRMTNVRQNGQLLVLNANLDLWEFVMYLSPGQMDKNLVPGQVYERSYLATQRAEYLQQQLTLEMQATEIAYHTLQITNALATDEILETSSKPKLADIYRQDPIGLFVEDDVNRAYRMMVARRDLLWQSIDHGQIPVKSLFFYEEFEKEIENTKNVNQRQMAVRKYADAVLRAKSVLRPNSTLELHVVDGLSKEEMQSLQKETFALIKIKGGRDEAVCYAEMAKPGEKLLQTHLIVVNGAEVANKRRIFDRSLARAWSHRDSILRLAAKLVDVERTLHSLSEEEFHQLESLHSVVTILDRSIDSKSLEFLGGGSFGDVYRAHWNGIPVALKFLKEAARPQDVATFEAEFRQLKQAEHENIVKVYKLTVENNRLGLIMEFMDGGSLRQLLMDSGAQPAHVVMRCALQISAAIEHLHSLKIVHRDVKTDNILVSKDLSIFKLADFGLARMVERTEQYKTVKGTYRYMAPEILRGRDGSAKYSLKVDVYSFGLILMEMTSGSQVFFDLTKEELENGKREGRLQPLVSESCEVIYGSTIANVIRLSIAPADRRPKMSTIHHILRTDHCPNHLSLDGENPGSLSILCLGTGKGATALMHGEPSSSFALMYGGKPLLIVDLGLGVATSLRQNLSKELKLNRVYITHNHADHAAELPVALAVLYHRRQKNNFVDKPVVFAAPRVMDRVTTHRMHEVCAEVSKDDLAQWETCPPYPHLTSLNEQFSISPVLSKHTEVCYGFMLYERGVPVLGFSGDSGFESPLYDVLFTAPNVILDARSVSSIEHAGFQDVIKYLSNRNGDDSVFITGYGIDDEFPEKLLAEMKGKVTKMRCGHEYSLRGRCETNETVDYVSTEQALH